MFALCVVFAEDVKARSVNDGTTAQGTTLLNHHQEDRSYLLEIK
jgi:hypothetical protein